MIDPRPALIVRPEHGRRRCHGDPLRARARPADRGSRGRPQRRRPGERRRRPRHRPVLDQRGRDRSDPPHRHGRWWRHLGPARRGHPAVRPRDAGRRRQRHGNRWPHPRRRHGLAATPARAERRQHDRRRGRARRRADRLDERDPATRAAVGPAWRRREFRGRDDLRVPPPPDRAGGGLRERPLPARGRARGAARARAVRGRGPGRRHQHDRGARAHPAARRVRPVAPRRPVRGGPRHVRGPVRPRDDRAPAAPRAGNTARGLQRDDALHRGTDRLRRRLSGGPSLLLEVHSACHR